MENDRNRGRSPSPAYSQNFSPHQSPNMHHNAASELGLDPTLLNSSFMPGQFAQAGLNRTLPMYTDASANPHGLEQTANSESLRFEDSQLKSANLQNHQTLAFQDAHLFQNEILQNNPALLFANADNNMQGDFDDTNFPLNSPSGPMEQPNVNPANLSNISSSHTSTPPNLLSPDRDPSPVQLGSPTSTQGQFYTPQHSRHQSLDPASAAYPLGPAPSEWQGLAFQQHTREPSDQSDLSSNSASPFLPHTDIQDATENNPSPMMGAQQDGMNAFGIENFSINDHSQSQISPGHSPYISPRLMPQTNLGLGMGSDFPQPNLPDHVSGPGPEIYAIPPDSTIGHVTQMHTRNVSVMSDMGRADQFPAPTINIEPAPVSRQASFEAEANNPGDTLSPPTRPRGRSKSDPHVSRPVSRQISRSTSPTHRPHTPSLGSQPDDRSARPLSPGLGPLSRESSPGPSSGRIEKSRRQSTSSISTREYFLGLADPKRLNDPSSSHPSTRGQKHPATFQCHLCPKRFTRAYNLRSHLRTHTDERPFVCTVCGKAFARQHDRKRHEGLHSGEKKFVCHGTLGSGSNWGCGRKFARADALGRHFRSEAGRICIKPLLDEEAAERARNQAFGQQHQQAQPVSGTLQPVQPSMMMNMDASGEAKFTLPAALLAQYPALNNIDWTTIPQSDDGGDLSDVGMGRNSFDASSRGEMGHDDSDVNESYAHRNGLNYATGAQDAW